jgi:hypothetical protein
VPAEQALSSHLKEKLGLDISPACEKAGGYRAFFVSDCSGGMSVEAHQDAKTRLVQAGRTRCSATWTPSRRR